MTVPDVALCSQINVCDEEQGRAMTLAHLETILQSLGPKRRVFAQLNAPRTIQVKGAVYRLAETITDKLLALSIEIQDYDLPNLDNWTDLSNRMLAALDTGKDSIEVAGKSFTAQQLYDTLERLLRKTQQQHQQLWKEKELARKQRLEFYQDPDLMKPAPGLKPPTTKTIASAPDQVKFRGAVYHLAAPALPPEYNLPVSAADLDPEVISWFHSSQGDPIYALGSRLYADGETLASEEELVALSRTLDKWLMGDHEDDQHLDRIQDLYYRVNELVYQIQKGSDNQVSSTQASVPKRIKLKGATYRLANNPAVPAIKPVLSVNRQVGKMLHQFSKLLPETSWSAWYEADGTELFYDNSHYAWPPNVVQGLIEQLAFALDYRLVREEPEATAEGDLHWTLVPTRRTDQPDIQLYRKEKGPHRIKIWVDPPKPAAPL
jgi:hypothetical protein